MFVLIGINYQSKIFERINGINNFSKIIHNISLKNNFSNLVISDRLLFANMSYELRDVDIKIYMPHNNNGRITNHFMLSAPLSQNMKKDFILIGPLNDIEYLKNNYEISNKRKLNARFTKKSLKPERILPC